MKNKITRGLAFSSAVCFAFGAVLVLIASLCGTLKRMDAYLTFMEKTKMQNVYIIGARIFGAASAVFFIIFALGLLLVLCRKNVGFTGIKLSIGAFTALLGTFLIALAVYNFSSSMVSIAITRDYTAGTPLLVSVAVIAIFTVLLFVFCSKAYKMTSRLKRMFEVGSKSPVFAAYVITMLFFAALVLTASLFTGGRIISDVAAVILALANVLLASSIIRFDLTAKETAVKSSARLYMLEEMRGKKE